MNHLRILLGLFAALLLAGLAAGGGMALASTGPTAGQTFASTAQDTTAWIRQFGTSHTDGAEGVGLDGEGNLYVAGYTWDSLDNGEELTGYDAFLTKFSPEGQELWTRNFGTPASDYAWAVAVTKDNGLYVMGHTRGELPGQVQLGREDVYLMRFDFEGNAQWTRQFGTEYRDEPSDVAVDEQGNAYVAGIARIALPGQEKIGNEDAYVRKYDTGGSEVWTRQFGTKGTDLMSAVTVGGDGSVYAVGPSSGTFPGETWAGKYDSYLAKFDSAGTMLWAREFGTVDADNAVDVAVDAEGRVFVVGFYRIAKPGQRVGIVQNALLHRFDGDGNMVWQREFGTMDEDFATEVVVDSGGAVYVVGRTDGALPGQQNSGGNDVFVRKYNLDGDELWTHQFGSTSGDNVRDITLDAQDNLYLVGRTNGTLPGQSPEGLADGFLVKLFTGFQPPPPQELTGGEARTCAASLAQGGQKLSLGWALLGLLLAGMTLSRARR